MPETEAVTVVRGEEDLFRRTAHLFAAADDVACAANDLATFAWRHSSDELLGAVEEHRPRQIRKIYRQSLLLDARAAAELAHRRDRFGARIRVSAEPINETIIIDGRLLILAGDRSSGPRSYSVISQRDTVQAVQSLFETAWRAATELAVHDARIAEIRQLAPRVLDLLGQGVTDERAARLLGLGVRTYRRRVAELLDALGAQSRFQAGVRARELGLA